MRTSNALRISIKEAKKCLLYDIPNMIDNKVSQLWAIKDFLEEVKESFYSYCNEQIEVARDEDDDRESLDGFSDDEENSQDEQENEFQESSYDDS